MKAVILAGGEGTRLRPVSSGLPKPMVPVMGRPVLEHILRLLKKHGITQICLTLRFLPELIAEYFGDGEGFGVELEHRIEREPLGTAGAVRSCLDFTGDEDFLVLSGDAVCDFDLEKCLAFHRSSGAEATIVLTKSDSPLEYGLAVLGEGGKIERFVEKPGWDGVVTDLVSSGLYILSPSVLKSLPEGKNLDFARDVFPAMLRERRALYGFAAEGYWCDIGSPESYLQCSLDALRGALQLELPPRISDGVWSASPIAPEVTVLAPCCIESGVSIGSGSVIGPDTVLCSGSTVGQNARIAGSVVNGAYIGDGAEVSGSIVCSGAQLERGCSVCPGSVIGALGRVGAGSCVCEDVKVWPAKQVPAGAKLSADLVMGAAKKLSFSSDGSIRGEYGADITPAGCLKLGAAAASFAPYVGCGGCGGDASLICAEALACSACANGARVLRLDCAFPSEAAFASSLFALPLTVFFASGGSEIHFFGSGGAPLSRINQRKIESALHGAADTVSPSNIGRSSVAAGVSEAYIASGASFAVFPGKQKTDPPVSVSGHGAAARAARAILSRIGAKTGGGAEFSLSNGGFSLSAIDEEGDEIDPDRMLLILALLEFENGCGCVAVPYSAPAALELLASSFGARVLRLGRDGEEAARLWSAMPFLRHAPFALGRLYSGMSVRGENLHSLSQRIPKFSRVTREVRLTRPRAAVMRMMSEYCTEMGAEFDAGIRISGNRGCVRLAPSGIANSIILSTESKTPDAAGTLCSEFERLLRTAEKRI